MSWLTGLGPQEPAVLEAMDGLGAVPSRPYIKCDRIVRSVEERFGYGRSYTKLEERVALSFGEVILFGFVDAYPVSA